MVRLVVILCSSLVLFGTPASARAENSCERVAVVPLDPVGLSPHDARVEEERVRHALEAVDGVCLVPREQTAATLKSLEGHRLPPCDEVSCRRELAARFDADWLVSGTAFGFGGARSAVLSVWNRAGTVVQRGSFLKDEDARALLKEARLGRSLGGEQVPQAQVARSHWPEVALGAGALASLAAGTAFALASRDTAQRVSTGRTGCAGTGLDYQQCFARTVHAGEGQATAANVLFGAGALLGAGAAVFFVVELP